MQNLQIFLTPYFILCDFEKGVIFLQEIYQTFPPHALRHFAIKRKVGYNEKRSKTLTFIIPIPPISRGQFIGA
jgi:hypothetical protein